MSDEFPTVDLLPKAETQATAFLEKNPSYDGRGVIVAIFDTGVDPGVPLLQKTTTGAVKIIHSVDVTGSGDVDTSTVAALDDMGQLTGLTGRKLTVSGAWTNPTGRWHLGLKKAYELFPAPLVTRCTAERREHVDKAQQIAIAEAREKIIVFDAAHRNPTPEDVAARKELSVQLEVLDKVAKSFSDPGPVYDCVVFHDGTTWRGVVDVSETGDLSKSKVMASYSENHEWHTFSQMDMMNYVLNIENEGNLLSIVTNAGSHGTHVAAIVGAHDPARPESNGIAPGVQIIAVKIGDTRLGSMETGKALNRGLMFVLKHKCHIINLSYGEATTVPDVGRFVSLTNEIVHEHGIVFVASAGNNGPALSTVGAPGGTTSSIIGVGAHVSPPMMKAGYHLREAPAAQQFTWSSRGPTIDGEVGVSISAPGGAVTQVPAWTHKAGQLMNGTSMSSPNACGGVALVLSGLLALGVPYSPVGLRRSLENTALASHLQPVDHGYGLLQVDAAFQHCVKHAADLARDVRFDISVDRPGFSNQRGIYLREPRETVAATVVDATVAVTPVFHKHTLAPQKIAFEALVTLRASHSWLQIPKHMALMNESRSFSVQVDVASVPAGHHYAEICAFVPGAAANDPIFRVPVMVIKPVVVADFGRQTLEYPSLTFVPGQLHRLFIAVPEHASWATVELDAGSEYHGDRLFVVHALQCAPHCSYKEFEHEKSFRMVAREHKDTVFAVLPGATLEICVAQWWSSLGASTLSVKVTFNGLTSPDAVIFHANVNETARFDVVASLRPVVVAPTGKLSLWSHVVAPVEPGVVKPTTDSFNGRRVYEITLNFKFRQAEKSDVRPILPVLSTVLYESAFEGQMWMLFDANKKLVKVGDAFPSSYNVAGLPKGDYVLRLQVRHEDAAALAKLANVNILLERPLAKTIPISFFGRAPVCGGSALKEASVPYKGRLALFATVADAAPAGSSPGDVLSGEISLLKGDAHKATLKVQCYVGAPTKATAKLGDSPPAPAPAPAPTPSLDNILRDARIAWLAKLSGPEYTALFEQLRAEHAHHLPLLVSHLKAVVAAQATKKEDASFDYAAVVQAADAVLAEIDTTALAAHFGANIDKDSPAGVEANKAMEEQRKTVKDAAFRKAHALNVAVRHNADNADLSAQLAAGVAELKKWANPAAEPDMVDFFADYLARGHQLGAALQVIHNFITEQCEVPQKSHLETRNKLLAALGWQHLIVPNELITRLPPAYPLF